MRDRSPRRARAPAQPPLASGAALPGTRGWGGSALEPSAARRLREAWALGAPPPLSPTRADAPRGPGAPSCVQRGPAGRVPGGFRAVIVTWPSAGRTRGPAIVLRARLPWRPGSGHRSFPVSLPFPADRVTAPPPTPPPSSPRELAGGPPAGKVPGGEGWSHARRLTGRLRTQAGRPASLLPPGPWRAPLRPREYLPRGELCLEDERPLAGLKPRSPGRVGPRRLLGARGPRTHLSRRTRRTSPWPRRGRSSWTRTTACGPASSTCRGAGSSRCSRSASCSSAWPSPSALCASCASTSRGWTRSVPVRLVPAGRACVGAGGARPASPTPVCSARAGAALCSS